MYNNNLWEIAFSLAGIGAIGSFVFWSLYKNYLKLQIFSKLTKKQTFHLMLTFLGLTFLFALVTLFVFASQQTSEKNERKVNSITSGDYSKNTIVEGSESSGKE